MSTLVLGAQLVATLISGFFLLVTLGFAGEATRTKELNILGWMIGGLYLICALTPFFTAVWVTFRRFISNKEFPVLEIIPSPYVLPLVLLIGSAAFCAGLLALQTGVGMSAR